MWAVSTRLAAAVARLAGAAIRARSSGGDPSIQGRERQAQGGHHVIEAQAQVRAGLVVGEADGEALSDALHVAGRATARLSGPRFVEEIGTPALRRIAGSRVPPTKPR